MRALAALAALAAAASDLRSCCSPAGYFLYRKFFSPAAATGYGTMQYQNTRDYSPQYTPVQEAPAINNDIDYRSLTMMDRSFDPNQFLKTSQDIFFKVQGAWNKQDTAALRSLCGSELMQTWEQELNNLRARGHQNKMENIALRESEITEAWTENGQDLLPFVSTPIYSIIPSIKKRKRSQR
jgi:predicted lipid-binding transport protein (Tim44 family)